MVIIGRTFTSNDAIFNELLEESNVLEISMEFAKEKCVVIDSATPCLFVQENECAVIRNANLTGNSPHIVGSDWATTCIVFLFESETHVCCFHIVSDEFAGKNVEQGIQNLKKFSSNNEVINVYALGGYVDKENSKETKLSKTILRRALVVLVSSDVSFDIKLMCCNQLNTCEQGTPIHMGIAFSVIEKRAFPVSMENAFGPEVALRSSQDLSTSDSNGLLIFDPETEKLTICPFEISFHEKCFKYLLSLDDAEFLRKCSTSPQVEPANFVSHCKMKYKYMLDNYPFMQKVFQDGQPRCYQLNNQTGVWTPVA